MERVSHLTNRRRRFGIVLILLIICWVLSVIPFPGTGFLAVGTIVASIPLAFRWRSALPLMLLLVNPTSISFCLGTIEWFNEKPRLSFMGLPGNEFFNLDPTTRCYRSTGGCLVTGNEWLTRSPHNAGLRLMVNLFGGPKGTYHGPYPSKAEAVTLTAAASETPSELFLKGTVLANGREIALGRDNVQKLLRDFGMIFFGIDSDNSSQKVRATIFQDRCLIIQISMKQRNPDGSLLDESEGVVLYDSNNLRPFARYVLSGNASRIPALLIN